MKQQAITIVILAAGSASRMGKPKQLLKIGTSTLLENAILQAQQTKAKNVFCVLGAHQEKILNQLTSSKIKFIINREWHKGLSTSINTAINYLQSNAADPQAILFMLVDQPLVDKKYLNVIIDLHQKHPSKIIASTYHKKGGVPALFPKKYFQDLKMVAGDKGARNYLIEQETNCIKLPSSHQLFDIDTPEDYEQFLSNTVGQQDKK